MHTPDEYERDYKEEKVQDYSFDVYIINTQLNPNHLFLIVSQSSIESLSNSKASDWMCDLGNGHYPRHPACDDEKISFPRGFGQNIRNPYI